jgi:APA family basic amino acid/polyamine antiporter
MEKPGFARRLGLFDASMLVMGGIVGSGIFMNPHVVARIVDTPWLILGAWTFGGAIALAGAFIYAELAARRPAVGGQYAYIREAFHPLLGFLFGWGLFLVSTSGGLAAVAMTFARYTNELTGSAMPEWMLAVGALAILTGVNCLGVRTGGTVQSGLMVLKIAAIALLVACGFAFAPGNRFDGAAPTAHAGSFDLLTSFGAALVPVMFAYGGWQTANFVAGEIRSPEKNLPRGLLLGVTGVVALYLGVNVAALVVLGAGGLSASPAPASAVMRAVLGETGATIIALGIAVSTLGFLSQGILTSPRVYYAMAEDGAFFRGVGTLHPKTRVPVTAILLQGIVAIAICFTGTYEQILSYVVSDDFIFFGLTAACVFVIRRRDGNAPCPYPVPGHPWTTVAFVLVCAAVVVNTTYYYPVNTLIGLGILAAGVPVYYFWKRRHSVPAGE